MTSVPPCPPDANTAPPAPAWAVDLATVLTHTIEWDADQHAATLGLLDAFWHVRPAQDDTDTAGRVE